MNNTSDAVNGNHKTYSEYPLEFRRQILALMVKPDQALLCNSLIRPEYFEEEREREFARNVQKHREQFNGKLPTDGDVIMDMPEDADFIKNVFRLSGNGLHRTELEVREFARKQAVAQAFEESLEDYQEGRYGVIVDRLMKAIRVGSDVTNTGIRLLEQDWLQSDYALVGPVGTPWAPINNILGGGLGVGELGLIMAPTGGLKSTALINIGTTAADVINRRNVLHFTLEMSEVKTMHRYAQRLTFEAMGDQKPEVYHSKLVEQAQLKLRGDIRVKHYPMANTTVRQLWDFALRMQDSGKPPGLVIVDYPDLLKAEHFYQEERFRLNSIFQNLVAMGDDLGVPVWGATQVPKLSYTKKVITKADISEAIKKAEIAHLLISINQTNDEAMEQQLRLFMAKVRDGVSYDQILCKLRYPAITAIKLLDRQVDDKGNALEADDDGFDTKFAKKPAKELA